MKDKLVVEESRRPFGYRIWWFLAEEQELGACVGSGNFWKKKEAPSNREEWECWAVECAIHSLPDMVCDSEGFYWESKTEAAKALKIAKEALKQDRPMPKWAMEALKQGWTPPKGWKA